MFLQHLKNKKLLYLLVISTVIRLLFAFNPISNGEGYYAHGALDMQLSYFDQPPLFFWLSGILIKLFGVSNFLLRLPSVLLFAGTTYLLYGLTYKIYKDEQAAYFSALLLNTSAVFSLSIGLMFQPDSCLIFFWILSFYAIYQILFPDFSFENINSYRSSAHVAKWWLVFGISIGLTALSKYHVVFLVFGLVLFLLINKNQRHWFWHWGPYVAMLIAALLFLPVIIWNYQNEWISFLFQSSRAGANQSSLRFDWFFRSIAGQALWILPWIWVPLVMQIPKLLKEKSEKLSQQYHFIFWTSIPVIFLFTIVTLWSDLQYHFHWQAPGYLMLFIPLGNWINEKAKNAKHKKIIMRSINATLILFGVLVTILVLHINTGFWTKYGLKWLHQKNGGSYDSTILMHNFEEVKDKMKERKWMENDSVFVGNTMWWMAGLIDYSLDAKKDFIIFRDDPRNYAFFANPLKLLNKDCILITFEKRDSLRNNVMPFFDSVELADSCWIERHEGEKAMLMYFYYCNNFKKPAVAKTNFPLYAQLNGFSPYELIQSHPPKENIWIESTNESATVAQTSFEYKNVYFRPSSIVEGIAYSGSFSCMLNDKNIYSETYSKSSENPIASIEMSCFIKCADSTDLMLVAEIQPFDTLQKKSWKGTLLNDKIVRDNQWHEIFEKLDFAKEEQKTGTINLYFWKSKRQREPVYIDDVKYVIK